jgi:cell division protein FtsB
MRDMTEPYETYDDQADYDWDYEAEDRPPRPRILWGRVISLVVFVLIAFFLGRMSVSDDAATDEEVRSLESEVTRLETENEQLDSDIADLEEALANNDGSTDGGTEEDPGTNDPGAELEPRVYVVQPGDSLNAILAKDPPDGYGCTTVQNEEGDSVSLVDSVVTANPGLAPNALNAGQEIILPDVPEGYSCT